MEQATVSWGFATSDIAASTPRVEGGVITSAMAGIYHRLLDRFMARPWLVLRDRISLPGWEKAVVAARSLAGASQ